MNLWLDDVRPPLIGYEWAKTVEQAKRLLMTGEVVRASLDHDLGITGTGYQLVCWMEETGHWPKEKPAVHSANPVGRKRMQQAIDRRYDR